MRALRFLLCAQVFFLLIHPGWSESGVTVREIEGICSLPVVVANQDLFVKNTQLYYPEVPRYLRKPAKAEYEVGDTLSFYVYNFRTNAINQISAVCRLKGTGTYIFVGLDEWNSEKVTQVEIDNFYKYFTQQTPSKSIDPSRGIREILTDLFGPTPNRSGDGFVYILIYDIQDDYNPSMGNTTFIAGYFSPRDQTGGSYSNLKDIIYVDCDPAKPSSMFTLGTIAHEFQHLIHYARDPNEVNWVNEGASMFAEFITGFGLANPSRYLRRPERSLTGWNYGGDDVLIDYVKVALYFYYLYEKFGVDLISEIVKAPRNSVQGVQDALSALNIPLTFDDIFANFVIANYADNPALDENGYLGYTNYNPPIRPTVTRTHAIYPVDPQAHYLLSYSAAYFRFTLADTTAKLLFKGQVGSKIRAQLYETGLQERVYSMTLDADNQGEASLRAIGKTAQEIIFIPTSLGTPNNFSYSVTTEIEDIWPPQIVSGPVESLPLGNSVTISWETDEMATSIVEYGLTTDYTHRVENNDLTISHQIVLTNLQPNTTYHYRVASYDRMGNGPTYSADFTFHTTSGTSNVIATVQQAHSYGYMGHNLAYDPLGNLHFVYHEKIGERRFVYHVSSSDGGQTWTSPFQIDSTLFYGGMPSIAVDSAGNLHVAWHARATSNDQFNIYYSRSEDGGQTWTAPVRLSYAVTGHDLLYPSIAVDPAGNVHVVWNSALYVDNYRGDIYHAYSTDGGKNWSQDKMISVSESHLCFVPTIQFTSTGKAFVFYSDGSFDQKMRKVYYVTSEDYQTWSSPRAISQSGVLYDGLVSFTIDSDDRVHVVFSDNYTPGDIRIMYVSGVDENWSDPIPVAQSATGGNVSYPFLAADNRNDLYLVYRDDMASGNVGKLGKRAYSGEAIALPLQKPGQTERGDVFLTILRDSQWLPAVNLSHDGNNTEYPELPLRLKDGVVDVVWMDQEQTSRNHITFLRFTTWATGPQELPHVTAVYPEANATDAPYFADLLNIWAVFSQRIDPDSLIPGNVTIESRALGPLPGEIAYIESERKFIFRPSQDLPPNDTVTVRLSARIPNLFGQPLDGNGNGTAEGSPADDFVWTFYTQPPDTQAPVLTIGVLQNPVLTRYVDLYIVSSEPLPKLPRLTLNGESVSLTEISPDGTIFKGDYRLEDSGVLTLAAEGQDYAGNVSSAEKSFSAQLLVAGSDGSILSADGRLKLDVPAGAVPKDLFITIVKQPEQVLGKPPARETAGLVYYIGPASFHPAQPLLLRILLIQDGDPDRVKKIELEHRAETGGWEPVPVRVEGNFAVAEIEELGMFRIREMEEEVPSDFSLLQNYPNPFTLGKGTTTFRFAVPKEEFVRLAVYNILGQKVASLLAEEKKPGLYQVSWDGRSDAGWYVPAGIYFVRLKTGSRVLTRKFLIIQ